MDIVDTLLYKNDEATGIRRYSKTKVISLAVFVVMFIMAIIISITTPTGSGVIISFFAAIIFALIFAVPVFIVGWVIGKFFNRNKKPSYNTTNDYTPMNDYTQVNNQNINNTTNVDFNSNINCPHDNANQFKNAIDNNDSNVAENILENWDNGDANYWYARIIFDGMPPSNTSVSELNNWLEHADNIRACDTNLKSWFRSTALQVINMNN